MPAEYRIDLEKGRVFSRATGDLSYATIAGHMDRLSKDPLFRPSFSQIIDFTDITTVGITSNEVVTLAEIRVFSPDSKRAFVAPGPLKFGLARMYEALRVTRGDRNIRVFTAYDEALEWLDLEGPGDSSADERSAATNCP
jgi:hypothetical protein